MDNDVLLTYTAHPPVQIPGDANNSGTVDATDAAILAANWHYGVTEGATGAVPEPGSLLLLAVGLVAIVIRRRR